MPTTAIPQYDSTGAIVGYYNDNGDGTVTTWDANGENPVTTTPSVATPTSPVSVGTAPLGGSTVAIGAAKGQALFASGPVSTYQAGNALSVLVFSIPSIGAFIATVPAGQQIGTIQDFIQMPDGSFWWYLYVGNAWTYASLNPLQSPYIFVPFDPALTYNGGTPIGVVAGAAAAASGAATAAAGAAKQTLMDMLAGLGITPTMLWVAGGAALLLFMGPELMAASAIAGVSKPRRRRRKG
jgi:hypothetical protein